MTESGYTPPQVATICLVLLRPFAVCPFCGHRRGGSGALIADTLGAVVAALTVVLMASPVRAELALKDTDRVMFFSTTPLWPAS